MHSLKHLTILIVLFISILGKVHAGAWLKPKGHGYLQLSFTHLYYDHMLNSSIDIETMQRSIRDMTLQFYGEYGITDKLNVLAVLPYKMVQTGDEILITDFTTDTPPVLLNPLQEGELSGLSNLQFGLKYLLHNSKYVVSTQVFASNPESSYDDSTGLRIGYDAWTFTPSLLIGRGFSKTYFSGEVGYQFRDNDYAHNFIAAVEYGYKWSREKSHTWFMAVVNAKVPVTDGTFDERNGIQNALYRDNSGYVSPGLKVNQLVGENYYITLGGYGAFWAKNEGGGATISLGLSYEW